MRETHTPARRWLRLRMRCWLVLLFLAGFVPAVLAQTKPPVYTETEKAFADQLTALPEADALAMISSADSSRITEGLYRAINEEGEKFRTQDPLHRASLCREAEAVATRAGLAMLAADSRLAQAQSTFNGQEILESLAIYDQALVMYQAVSASPQKLAPLYTNRAIARYRLGDLQAAMDDDNEAIRIDRQLGDEVAVARADNGLGNILNVEGRFSEAEAAFDEALRIARAHDEKLGEAFVLNNLSLIYSAQGEYPQATRFCEQSLEIKRQVGSKAEVATSLINLSNYYHMAGRDSDADRVLNEAAQIGHDLNRRNITAKATAQMGVIELDNHHPEPALKLLNASLEVGSNVEDAEGQVFTLNKIAEAWRKLKNYPEALKYSQQAAALARSAGMLDQLSTAALIEGEVYFEIGKLSEAREALKESIDAVEQMRGNLTGGAVARQKFLSQRVDPYRLLSAVAATQGDWPTALDGSERGKGRILLDIYTSIGVGPDEPLTAQERAEETRLQDKLVSLDLQYGRQTTSAHNDPAKVSMLDESLRKAQADLNAFRKDLYSRHPELRLRRADFSTPAPADLQTLAPQRTIALLEFELTPRGNYLLVITRGTGTGAEIHGYKLAVTSDELAQHVRNYHNELSSRDPEFAAESHWLYKALLQPASALLRGKTSLIVVPDGVLWQVPFQTLEKPDGSYMAESAAIDYVPSLTVLFALKSVAQAPSATRRLLAMGNPGGETQEQADEALALQQLYGAKNSRAFIGKAATPVQFRQNSASFDVVHIAAHGVFNDREPMASHMLLASTDGKPEAGWLRAREIQEMKLRAELVVFSGCETGRGSFEDGEGLLGMSWAVLAAGAHGSLASAWRVEASSTTQMMLAFHREMLHGATKAEALRRAELDVLHHEKYRHPFYWAAFVLVGDGA